MARPLYRVATLAAVASVLVACSESVVGPAPLKRAGSVASNAGRGPVPNGQKYRQQTTAHATGRSGSASLTGRALMAKDGSVQVELTTGQLDQSGAPGNISKVQLKFFHPASAEMHEPTQNYNGLTGGGTWTGSYNEKVRHQKFQAQSNIRGIDPKRTDVVTIDGRVDLRPDVAVTAVSAPGQAMRNTSVAILGTIAELNDDVGATTNCVLYVNGVEVDRANGVWVADGDMVTCAFAYTFMSNGNYTLTVRAESVVPGDWDLANNANSATIEIRDPRMNSYGYAYQSNYNYWWYDNGYNNQGWCNYWGSWSYDCSSYYSDWGNSGQNYSNYNYSYIQAWGEGTWQFPLNVATQHGTDGWQADWRWNTVPQNSGDCGYVSDVGFSIWACSYGGNSYVQAYRWSGFAYYYSYQYWNSYSYNYWCNENLGYCGSQYYPGSNGYYQYGPDYYNDGAWNFWYGSTVTWDIQVYPSNGGVSTASLSIPMQVQSSYSQYQPWTCDYQNSGTYYQWQYYQRCYQSSYTQEYKWGSGSN